jgi:hypothetical protein
MMIFFFTSVKAPCERLQINLNLMWFHISELLDVMELSHSHYPSQSQNL